MTADKIYISNFLYHNYFNNMPLDLISGCGTVASDARGPGFETSQQQLSFQLLKVTVYRKHTK